MDYLKQQFTQALNTIGVVLTDSQNVSHKGIYKQIKDNTDDDIFYLLVNKDSIQTGELITLDSKKYLVMVCNKNINGVYDRLTLANTHLPLKFIANEVLYSTYCLCDVGGMSASSSSTITILDGKIRFRVPKTAQTSLIKTNDRFIKFNGAFKCDKVTGELDGSLSIWCHVDSVAEGDDLINEIPVGLAVYTLTFNPTSYNLNVGTTQNIVPLVTKNGQSITTGFRMTYTSSNPSIATVDSNGLITPIADGTAIITGSLNDGIKTATITVNVTSIQIVTVEIMPQVVSLLQNQEQTYSVTKKINGVIQPDTFNIVGSVAPTANYTLTILGGNSFKVKNLKLYTGGKLRVTCTTTNGLHSNYIEIQLKGAF